MIDGGAALGIQLLRNFDKLANVKQRAGRGEKGSWELCRESKKKERERVVVDKLVSSCSVVLREFTEIVFRRWIVIYSFSYSISALVWFYFFTFKMAVY